MVRRYGHELPRRVRWPGRPWHLGTLAPWHLGTGCTTHTCTWHHTWHHYGTTHHAPRTTHLYLCTWHHHAPSACHHAPFQVLLGRNIADAFVQGFSPQGVPDDAITARDSAMRFPWQSCAAGQPASATHQCWEDLRPSGQARACREVPQPEEQSNPHPHPHHSSKP